jgi:hypothetical protein
MKKLTVIVAGIILGGSAWGGGEESMLEHADLLIQLQ